MIEMKVIDDLASLVIAVLVPQETQNQARVTFSCKFAKKTNKTISHWGYNNQQDSCHAFSPDTCL
jgi:hypothetical protein